MTLYVHHVPGRLRLRSRHLARSPGRLNRLRGFVEAMPGVRRVTVNRLAGSLMVLYDPSAVTADDIMERLAGVEDVGTPPAAPVAPASLLPPQAVAAGAARLGSMFGKALFDAVLHKGVERSIRLLVGGRR